MGLKTIKRIMNPRYYVIPVIILFTVLIVTNPVINLISLPGNHRKVRLQEDIVPHVLYQKAKAANTLLVDHYPIIIDGNSDFHDQVAIEGWSGDGTVDQPYIINGYRIEIDTYQNSYRCIYKPPFRCMLFSVILIRSLGKIKMIDYS